MAVTLTVAELRNAVRTEESTEEDQILTRLLAVGTALVDRAAPAAPDAIANEATVRVAAYLFDQPPSARGNGTANALRNSGAAGLLLPFRVHRAGSTGPSSGVATSTTTPSTPGAGVDTAAVNQLIADGVEDWAETGNTDPIPHEKLVNAAAAAHDQTARDAAAAAAAAAEQANDHLVDQDGVKRIVDQDVESWARTANADEKIPASKLPDSPAPSSGRPSTVLHEDVRLPEPARAMRIGWNQSRAITATIFTRANQHPIDGAVQGMTMGLDVPPAPPALAGDPTLYLAIWIEGTGDDGTVIRLGVDDVTDSFGMPMSLTVNGVDGHYHVTRERLAHATSRRLSVQIPGDMILGESDVAPWALADNADTIPDDKLPPAPSGGGLSLTILADISTSTVSGTDREWTATSAQATAISTAVTAGTYRVLVVRVGVDSGSGVHTYHDSPPVLMNETDLGGGFQLREFNWVSFEGSAIKRLQLDLQAISGNLSVKVALNASTTTTNVPSGPNGRCQIYGVQ